MPISNAQIDALNRFLATTVGREKACRFVQYFSRFYVFYLLRTGATKETVQRWNDLKSHISNGRKFFRLLKPIEFAQSGIKSLAVQDEVLRSTAVVKQFGMFFYYCSEALVLANAIKFYKFEQIKKISDFGLKCWFVALAASILSSLYKLKRAGITERMLQKSRTVEKDSVALKKEETALAKEKHTTLYQLVQDSVDILIPIGGLGWVPFDEGILGLAGMTTSLLAVNTQWKKVNPN
ncbi:Peroxisomal membrane protein PMP27 [Apophysomyces sp. BC1034]|nr:Peroxisomal membrane protein PMP27 [Apophysomyces sp. BC1015]KAG0179964.1 Peroxisomal membrane protein PMP27 [Apophysomyces sp. BC1021]KAG0189322.1 Peroxisomal membrane protein PMP27 [Apophysomyces sp. BC1034]